MPSEITHIFVSGILGKTYTDNKMPMRFWAATAICSVLPDIDILGYYLGIRYNSWLGHRGFFHSLPFALFVSGMLVLFLLPSQKRGSKSWFGMVLFFFAVIASHDVLDAMTDKGLGIGFFMPFDSHRYFMPWRPIHASPMSIQQFFSGSGLRVLLTEMLWIWTPLLLFYALVRRHRKRT